MQKPKRKTDSCLHRFSIYVGLRPTPVDITVSASLETCMARLKDKIQTQTYLGYMLNQTSIQVDFYQTSEDRYLFRALKKQYRKPPIEISGYLEWLADNDTQISGSAESIGFLTQFTLPIIVFLLVILIVLSFLAANAFLCVLLLDMWIMGMLALYIFSTRLDRHGFIRSFQEAATSPDGPKAKAKS